MNLELSIEQTDLQLSLRQLLAKECPTSLIRELRGEGSSGRPERLWSALADFGFFGLPFGENVGGYDLDLLDLGLAYQEAGRTLCPTMIYSTMAFGLALQALGTERQRDHWLKRLTAGEVSASIALWNPSNAGDLRPTVEAENCSGSWYLSGIVEFVPNADVVDVLLVTARVPSNGDGESTLGFLVEPGRSGLSMKRHRTHNGDIQCRVAFDNVEINSSDMVVESTGLAGGQLAWLSNVVVGLQCMEMVGGAQQVLQETVEYTTVRHQFGRPLASFQAVQHRVADMRIAIDAARLTALQAMWSLARGDISDRELVIAKLQANEAYKFTTLTSHILWGGMGYIVETDLHLWSERAKTTELLGGARDVLLARLERTLDIEVAS
ncbi:acyl-CoA/acyl-ACP dehydrogenase [Rhodococcus sp. T2V]|uniref:acyl-CoA dehydrogenase family protein n=1 Tax=Rhodococcus sp. T2V TaxID=3034164 RepID=UPI0023E296FE|nr:acyl-CoA dehydrogenase family protein [Rhodococcus sp. T2V]MDF3309670.1 acyl-CoA/acyl-ACP dehydrogenase [Rhodococcus sp. T2V]